MNKSFALALSFAAGLLMSSASALAQTTTGDAATAAQAAPAEDPNEIVCKAGEPVLGTRIPGSRICHTRKQWAQIQFDSQQALQQQQMQRSFNAGSSSGSGK